MAPPIANNASFFEGLAFRPHQKRKRDGSPTPDLSHTTTAPLGNNPSIHATLTHRPKPDETPHDAKRRRANDPGDKVEADETQAVVRSNNPKATGKRNTVTTLTLDKLSLNLSVARSVMRRRRMVVSPFIPRKQPVRKNAMVRYKPRPTPVFRQASLMTLDEAQLVAALDKAEADAPRVKVAENLSGLPKAAVDPLQTQEEKHRDSQREKQVCTCGSNAAEVNERSAVMESHGCNCGSTDAGIHVKSERYCICLSVASDTLVSCHGCFKAFHAVCLGLGRQGYALYQDDRREQAMLDDAEFYREDGGFTCSRCSDDKELADKEKWAPDELKAEARRKNKLFSKKHNLDQGEILPRECDHCLQQISGTRYECRYCDNFDLCPGCFTDPEVSSMHQHAAGDMKLR